MISPFHFIIKPSEGALYVSKIKEAAGEVITSSSIEDHLSVNRIAEVITVPANYSGPIISGDIIVVHHNVFRKFFDTRGNEKSSNAYISGDLFKACEEEVFAYKHNGGPWEMVDGYFFALPVKNSDTMNIRGEQDLFAEVYIPDSEMVNDGMKKGDVVCVRPNSEYEFTIDGVRMYRMRTRAICLMKEQ